MRWSVRPPPLTRPPGVPSRNAKCHRLDKGIDISVTDSGKIQSDEHCPTSTSPGGSGCLPHPWIGALVSHLPTIIDESSVCRRGLLARRRFRPVFSTKAATQLGPGCRPSHDLTEVDSPLGVIPYGRLSHFACSFWPTSPPPPPPPKPRQARKSRRVLGQRIPAYRLFPLLTMVGCGRLADGKTSDAKCCRSTRSSSTSSRATWPSYLRTSGPPASAPHITALEHPRSCRACSGPSVGTSRL